MSDPEIKDCSFESYPITCTRGRRGIERDIADLRWLAGHHTELPLHAQGVLRRCADNLERVLSLIDPDPTEGRRDVSPGS